MIRSTVHVSDVTGYLQVPEGSQSATLSFLPPPSVYQNAAPTALILEGWRGTAAPATSESPDGPAPCSGARRAALADGLE